MCRGNCNKEICIIGKCNDGRHWTSVCFMVLFSSKDEMCGAAQQSDLQVLVHSIKELQKAVRIIHFVPHT